MAHSGASDRMATDNWEMGLQLTNTFLSSSLPTSPLLAPGVTTVSSRNRITPFGFLDRMATDNWEMGLQLTNTFLSSSLPTSPLLAPGVTTVSSRNRITPFGFVG